MKSILGHKRNFTALYYNQQVMRYKSWPDDFEPTEIDGKKYRGYRVNPNTDNNNSYLELTPLSQITTKDLEKLVEILQLKPENFFSNTIGRTRVDYVRSLIKGNSISHYVGPAINLLCAYQYLQSEGYVFDDLYGTVEEKLEWGWIKLKEI